MLFFRSEFTDKTETYNELICQINEQIYKIAKTRLDNIRYGFKTHVNYIKYEDLVTYKAIIQDIMYCATAMCDVNTSMVVARVKKLISTPC